MNPPADHVAYRSPRGEELFLPVLAGQLVCVPGLLLPGDLALAWVPDSARSVMTPDGALAADERRLGEVAFMVPVAEWRARMGVPAPSSGPRRRRRARPAVTGLRPTGLLSRLGRSGRQLGAGGLGRVIASAGLTLAAAFAVALAARWLIGAWGEVNLSAAIQGAGILAGAALVRALAWRWWPDAAPERSGPRFVRYPVPVALSWVATIGVGAGLGLALLFGA